MLSDESSMASTTVGKQDTAPVSGTESLFLSSPRTILSEGKPRILGNDTAALISATPSTVGSVQPSSGGLLDGTEAPREERPSISLNTQPLGTDSLAPVLGESSSMPEQETVASEGIKTPLHTIVCHEWQTEYPPALHKLRPQVDVPSSTVPVVSCIPEKDAVLWKIKDFTAFRAAAQASQLPPLVSPDFGGGCRLRLFLFDKKAHVSGCVELPLVKARRDGVIHVKIYVVRPDLKIILSRKVEMRITVSGTDKVTAFRRTSPVFRLSQKRTCRSPKYKHLIVDDQLHLRVELQYFPFDSPVFRGLTSMDPPKLEREGAEICVSLNEKEARLHGDQRRAELLHDIRNYCQDDPSQNVEIRRDDVIFHSCRFLLCARSRRFREIFAGRAYTGSGRGSPSRFLPMSRAAAGTSPLTSVTLRDIPADALDEMLAFIHTDTCSWLEDCTTDILKVLELFEAADLYGVDSLTSRLTYHLTQRMDIDNFVYMFEVSERCKNDTFKRICARFMDSIPGSQVATLMRATSLGESTTHVPATLPGL